MKIYHLVDHPGFGTIHKLLIPLCEKYTNHIMLTPYEGGFKFTPELMAEINSSKCCVIIHSTGRKDSIYFPIRNVIFSCIFRSNIYYTKIANQQLKF